MLVLIDNVSTLTIRANNMPKLTKKQIILAASQATGVKAEYIELGKTDGFYFWSGKAGAVFSESTNYMTNLTNCELSRWVEDFEYRVKEAMNSIYDNQHPHFNDYIESIDWDVT